jgi:IS30 family transposase
MTGLRLTAEQRRMIRRLSAEGLSLRQVARQVSCSHEGVSFVLRGHRSPYTRSAWEPAGGRLTVAEREEVSLGVHRGETFSAIASRLGRATSTVSREVAANGGRAGCCVKWDWPTCAHPSWPHPGDRSLRDRAPGLSAMGSSPD